MPIRSPDLTVPGLRGHILAAVLLAAGGCGSAMASLVTYDLVNATTAGGASLTGSIVYDSLIDKLTSVNIHETADLVYGTAATTFTHFASGFPGGLIHSGLNTQLIFQDDNVAGNAMVISLIGGLGGLGPYAFSQNPAISYIYVAARFVPASSAPYDIINGSLVARVDVPEPASFGLVAIALLGAAAAGRKGKV